MGETMAWNVKKKILYLNIDNILIHLQQLKTA
jgi:hypothetical protein